MRGRLRRYVKNDLPVLIEIANENYNDYGDFFYAYEFVPYSEETFRSRVVRRCPTVLVAEDQGVEGFITLFQAHWGDGIGILCVKKSTRRREIENLLISRIEKEAKSGRIVVTLTSGSAGIPLFQKKGYEIYGGLYHMTADLKDAYQIPELDKGITLRSLAAGEEEMLTRIFHPLTRGRGFQPGFLETWKEMDPFLTRDWIHVAEMDGKIVSVACTRREYEYNKHFNTKRAAIGPLITVPEYRRKGLAKALMWRGLNFFIKQKIETATLEVLEDNLPAVNLYKSLGFKLRHHWKFLRKHLRG